MSSFVVEFGNTFLSKTCQLSSPYRWTVVVYSASIICHRLLQSLSRYANVPLHGVFGVIVCLLPYASPKSCLDICAKQIRKYSIGFIFRLILSINWWKDLSFNALRSISASCAWLRKESGSWLLTLLAVLRRFSISGTEVWVARFSFRFSFRLDRDGIISPRPVSVTKHLIRARWSCCSGDCSGEGFRLWSKNEASYWISSASRWSFELRNSEQGCALCF